MNTCNSFKLNELIFVLMNENGVILCLDNLTYNFEGGLLKTKIFLIIFVFRISFLSISNLNTQEQLHKLLKFTAIFIH